jgi:hypothetical protein
VGSKRDINDNKEEFTPGAQREEVICIKKYLVSLYAGGDNISLYLEDTEKRQYEEILESYYRLYNKIIISYKFNYIVYEDKRDLAYKLLNDKKMDSTGFCFFEDGRIYFGSVSRYIQHKNETNCPCCHIMGNLGPTGIIGPGAPHTRWNFPSFLQKINSKNKL